MKNRIRMNPYDIFSNSILAFILIVVLIFAAWVGVNLISKNSLFNGLDATVIVTQSMEPTIKTNGLVLLKDDPYSSVKEGDIIMFATYRYGYVIHRVIQVTDEGFITKGDNNKNPDSWVITKDLYKAKVYEIHNETAEIFELVFGDGTLSIPSRIGRVLAILIGVALAIGGVCWVLNWLYDYIFIVFFLKLSLKKGTEKVHEDYYYWLDSRVMKDDLRDMLLQLNKQRGMFKKLLFRFRVMQVHNAMNNEQKAVRKAAKRYQKLRRGFIDDKDNGAAE